MDQLLLASEPWSPDCKLFHPLQDQILLYESANCISVQAFLKMCGLPFEIETRANAENMSPSGQVPFIKCGSFVISEMDPIIEFAKTKGYSLSSWLNETQLADMRAYMTLVDQVLLNAEYYICWCHEPTLSEYTYPRYTSPYPWPLNTILFALKKRSVHKRLAGVDMNNKTYDEVMESVESTLQALSDLLTDWKTRPYFFGDKPTELDALVFGHLSAILTTAYIDDRLAVVIKENKSLERLCNRIATEYFHVRKSAPGYENTSRNLPFPIQGFPTHDDLDRLPSYRSSSPKFEWPSYEKAST